MFDWLTMAELVPLSHGHECAKAYAFQGREGRACCHGRHDKSECLVLFSAFMHKTQKVVFIAKPQPTDTHLNMTSHRFSQAQVQQWFYNARKRNLYEVDPLQSTVQFPFVESCVKDKRKSDKSTAEEPGKRRRSRSVPTHSPSSSFKSEVTSVSVEEDAEAGDMDDAVARIMSVIYCSVDDAREALVRSNMDHDAALGYVVNRCYGEKMESEVTGVSVEEDAEAGDMDAVIARIMSVIYCSVDDAREALMLSNMDHETALGYVVKEWD